MTEELAKRIVRLYNKNMKSLISKYRGNYANNDLAIVQDEEFSYMWEKVYPYADFFAETWTDFLDSNEHLKEVGITPYIAAFSKYEVLKSMYRNIPNLEYKVRRRKIVSLYEYKDLIGSIIKVPKPWKIRFVGGYDVEFYVNKGDKGDDLPSDSMKWQIVEVLYSKISKIEVKANN